MRLLIQEGRQFVDLGENTSQITTDIKIYNELPYIVFESLSNETIKFLLSFSFK